MANRYMQLKEIRQILIPIINLCNECEIRIHKLSNGVIIRFRDISEIMPEVSKNLHLSVPGPLSAPEIIFEFFIETFESTVRPGATSLRDGEVYITIFISPVNGKVCIGARCFSDQNSDPFGEFRELNSEELKDYIYKKRKSKEAEEKQNTDRTLAYQSETI